MTKFLIGITGKSCSGKTSLAEAIRSKTNADTLSFGSYIRQTTHSVNLQDLGQMMVSDGPKAFVLKFLAAHPNVNRPILIIEGIRHVSVWDVLQELYNFNILVGIDADEPILTKRVADKKSISLDSAAILLKHPVEADIPLLLKRSKIILKDQTLTESADIVCNYIRNHHLT